MTPANKRTHAAQEELRNLLAELQQVAENAITSSIDSTLNAAIRETANTIDDFHLAKRQEPFGAPIVSSTIYVGRSASPAQVLVNAPVCGSAGTASVKALPGHNLANAARSEFKPTSQPVKLTLSVSRHWVQSSRWTYAGISTIVLLTIVFVLFIAHLPHLLAAKPGAGVTTAYHADRKDDGNIRSLTIVVQPNQTIEALSSEYVGHFDYQVLQEIRALNPGLADPGHLEPGKALKLPLPREVRNEVRKK
jgi:phage tail protein X